MLSENIKSIRRSKGLSQEEFAVKLTVVRQTVSKWERGLSVPDSDLLILISEVLETPVNVLLGETVTESQPDELKTIAEKLEVINLQLARMNRRKMHVLQGVLGFICILIILVFVAFFAMDGSYLSWNYNDPELVVAGTILHGLEFLLVRIAPIIFIICIVGIALIWRKQA